MPLPDRWNNDYTHPFSAKVFDLYNEELKILQEKGISNTSVQTEKSPTTSGSINSDDAKARNYLPDLFLLEKNDSGNSLDSHQNKPPGTPMKDLELNAKNKKDSSSENPDDTEAREDSPAVLEKIGDNTDESRNSLNSHQNQPLFEILELNAKNIKVELQNVRDEPAYVGLRCTKFLSKRKYYK